MGTPPSPEALDRPSVRVIPMVFRQLQPPREFVAQRSDHRLCWLKVGWEETIRTALAGRPEAGPAAVQGGRGQLLRVALGERGSLLIRHYRRGGFIRHLVRDTYWDRPPRPLAELSVTQFARRCGVPTGEVLGAWVGWRSFGLYRGALISRAADGYTNWWAWLTTRPSFPRRRRVVLAVAGALARLHAVGIQHADLNLTNVLVRVETETPAVLLIDFDRAHIFPAPLPARRCRHNLRRLRRSISKLDPHGQYVSAQEFGLLLSAYHRRRAGSDRHGG